jgi:tyrosinase
MIGNSLLEMVGATEAATNLGAERVTAHLNISEPTGPALLSVTESTASTQAYLNLENIKSTGVPGSYAVFVNLPEGSDPTQNRHLFAGLLPSFGVAEASVADEHRSGSGLSHALNITKIVGWLKANGQWDPHQLRVTFVPRGKPGASPPVTVGRTSLFYR